jgi:hypothetical protein
MFISSEPERMYLLSIVKRTEKTLKGLVKNLKELLLHPLAMVYFSTLSFINLKNSHSLIIGTGDELSSSGRIVNIHPNTSDTNKLIYTAPI